MRRYWLKVEVTAKPGVEDAVLEREIMEQIEKLPYIESAVADLTHFEEMRPPRPAKVVGMVVRYTQFNEHDHPREASGEIHFDNHTTQCRVFQGPPAQVQRAVESWGKIKSP